MKYSKMPELEDIVTLLKNSKEFKEKLTHVNEKRILYASYSKKNSSTKAKIGKVPQRFSVFLEDYDYFMEINQENWLASTESERLYVILHELFHIPLEGFDKESKYYKKTVDHDIQEFSELLKQFGIDGENIKKLITLIS